MAQSDDLRRGTVLSGKYELHSVLGKGGMGVVFRGKHLGTDRPIAVKVLRRELMSDATLTKRFVREAKAAAALQHPNVVDVLDYGVDEDGTAFHVLELLEGESLGEHLERKGTIPIDTTLSLLLPVIHALAVAHARGVIHRDLKPDNVFLSRNAHGRIVPKLLDFGIAKLMRKDGGISSTLATRAGSAIGTPAYMSPEQARGTADVGTTTDVWAIGVILFECVAGRIPFEAETGSILMARIIMEQAPSLASVAPDTPAPIVAVIDRALASKSDERWPTMAAFAEALRSAAAESGITVPPLGASDTAPMSLPPPRSEAALDTGRDAFSSGVGDSDDDFDFHPETRVARPRDPRSATSAPTQPRVPRHVSGIGPAGEGSPPGEEIDAPAATLAPGTSASTGGDAGPSRERAGPRIPIVPVVAISLVLAMLAFLGLWMREPPAAVAPEVAAPIVAAPPPVAPPPSVAEPLAPSPEAAAVVAEEVEAALDEPAAPAEPVAAARDRHGRPSVAREAAPVGPTTSPPTTPREPGSHLPELTEW